MTFSYIYNPAYQITTRTGTNGAYDWTPANGTVNYTDNGLNQYTNVGGAAQTYDGRGNLTSGGFGYDALNQLTSGPNSASLVYDPQLRLFRSLASGMPSTRFLYDGGQIIGEYNNLNELQRRYVPEPGLDAPLVWYEGAGTTDPRWLAADNLGSIIAVMNASGAATSINSYDAYGQRGPANVGRFQFNGQPWLPEVGLYHYRARSYSPSLGRFVQSDPILHAGGMNLYAYVGNDPVNFTDPLGLADQVDKWDPSDEIVVIAHNWTHGQTVSDVQRLINRSGQFGTGGGESEGEGPGLDFGTEDEIVVVGVRPPTFGGQFVLIQSNVSTPPRDAECTMAAYACIMTSHESQDRDLRRAACHTAQQVCEALVDVSRADPTREFFMMFPDHSVVRIINGQAQIIRQGGQRPPRR